MKKMITEEQYQAAQKNGITRSTLNRRVSYNHWDIEKAINTPIMSRKEIAKVSYMSKISVK